jgi:hypothetical protein
MKHLGVRELRPHETPDPPARQDDAPASARRVMCVHQRAPVGNSHTPSCPVQCSHALRPIKPRRQDRRLAEPGRADTSVSLASAPFPIRSRSLVVPADRVAASGRRASSPSTDASHHPHCAEAFLPTVLSRACARSPPVRTGRRFPLLTRAEDAGFEPARAVNPTRFPSVRHRPLGESSARKVTGNAEHGRTRGRRSCLGCLKAFGESALIAYPLHPAWAITALSRR